MTSYKLGSLSSSFESNGDPAAIGYDATGGYSYGTYQIETKNGTMKDFITFLNNSPNNLAYSLRLQNADGLKGAADKTPAFEEAWKELAQDSGFVQAQRDFIIEKKTSSGWLLFARNRIQLFGRAGFRVGRNGCIGSIDLALVQAVEHVQVIPECLYLYRCVGNFVQKQV